MKFILIGPLPPPPSGQAVSFEMLVNFMQIKYKETKVIDIASRIKFKNIHIRNLLRFLNILALLAVLFLLF